MPKNRRKNLDVFQSKMDVVNYLRKERLAGSAKISEAIGLSATMGRRQIANMVAQKILTCQLTGRSSQGKPAMEYSLARGGIKRLRQMYNLVGAPAGTQPRLIKPKKIAARIPPNATPGMPSWLNDDTPQTSTSSSDQGVNVSGPYLTISLGGESHTVDYETGRELYEKLNAVYGKSE